MKKVFSAIFCVAFIICSCFNVAALSVSDEDSEYKVDIPKNFYCYTQDDIYKDSSFFNKMPIDKQQAIQRVRNGTVIDAFSKDGMREIKLTVGSDKLSEELVNLSPLSDEQIKNIADTLKSGIEQNAGTVLWVKSTDLSGYKFIKYCVRVGSSDTGYCYTTMMTVIGGKFYELTCYDSAAVVNDEMAAANDEVFSSFKLNVKAPKGMGFNTFYQVVSVIVIIVCALVIVVIGYSFVMQLVNRRKTDENQELLKRK
ncbi:MAG: hypothetical protein IJF54_05865 [Clostridia bacterium]|nr:hypothetical protein [Clostridia bacterium]